MRPCHFFLQSVTSCHFLQSVKASICCVQVLSTAVQPMCREATVQRSCRRCSQCSAGQSALQLDPQCRQKLQTHTGHSTVCTALRYTVQLSSVEHSGETLCTMQCWSLCSAVRSTVQIEAADAHWSLYRLHCIEIHSVVKLSGAQWRDALHNVVLVTLLCSPLLILLYCVNIRRTSQNCTIVVQN